MPLPGDNLLHLFTAGYVGRGLDLGNDLQAGLLETGQTLSDFRLQPLQ